MNMITKIQDLILKSKIELNPNQESISTPECIRPY